MAESAGALTIAEYISSMDPWIRATIARTARRDHPILSREDLLQEAKYTLVQVWNKYAGAIPEDELRRCGTRAVFNHTVNLYERSRSRGAADITNVSLDGGFRSAPHVALRQRATVLDGLIVREDDACAAALGSEGVGAALRLVALQEDSGLPMSSVEKARTLFAPGGRSAVGKKVRSILYRDGYVQAEQSHSPRDGRENMVTLTKGPMDPDSETFSPAGAADLAASSATKKRAGRARSRRAQTVNPAGSSGTWAAGIPESFSKGQVVIYAGGSRAAWLAVGAELVVKGPWTHPSGRLYLRCVSVEGKRAVVISPSALAAKAADAPE